MSSFKLERVLLPALLMLSVLLWWTATSASVSAQARMKGECQIVKADRVERSPGAAFEVKGLNKLGDEGWEAVGMNENWVLLRRSR